MTAALAALALLAFMIESAFPPVFPFAPHVKLGVSNVFVLAALVLLGESWALLLSLTKSLLSAAFAGASSLLYSLPAGLCSLVVMALLLRLLFPAIGAPAVSAAGSAVFNAAQLGVYALLSGTPAALYYIPISVLLSVATGAVTGLCVALVLKALPLRLLRR